MAVAAACILWFAVIMYSIFGGADYGAGFWDLSAGGTRRGERPRGLIDHAMAPVWEANNVWLIFAAIVCWTAFSEAFGSIMRTLYVPIILAGVGIVVRGAGFAFRKVAQRAGRKRVLTAAFGISSVITPFMLGAALGGIASGRVPAGQHRRQPLGELAQLHVDHGRDLRGADLCVHRGDVPRRRRQSLLRRSDGVVLPDPGVRDRPAGRDRGVRRPLRAPQRLAVHLSRAHARRSSLP